MKRVLMLASVASMIDQFNMPNIALLQKLGYEVDVACNFIEGNTCSDARVAELKQKLQDMHVHCYQIDFARNIDRWCGRKDCRTSDQDKSDLYGTWVSFLSGGTGYELAGVLSGGEDAEQMDGCVDNDQS